MSVRQTIFQHELEEAKKRAAEPIKENTNYFDQFKGLTFKEFWNKLDNKLEYFDYEESLAQDFEDYKNIWIKKATGLGITEFMIRWISWQCLKDDKMRDKQVDVNVIIITGPRLELSVTIMKRLKDLFPGHIFKDKETRVTLNGNKIEAFPSHHLAAARGLNPQIVFPDEADFFPKGQQEELRHVSERYIAKSNPHIIMVSTPNLPGGLYEAMEMEEESIYHRLEMPYTIGVGKVYSEEDIRKAKESPSFEREYNLQYGYGVGDIFEGIDDIITEYELHWQGGRACTTADPAFGFSSFGLCSGEVLDGILYIKEAGEFKRSSPSAMLDVMEESYGQHRQSCKVDAAHPGFIRDLQDRGVPAVPVNFGAPIRDDEKQTVQSLRSKMTINAAQMVKNGRVRIHPKFKTLLSQMRAVMFDNKGGIDKSEVSFDVVDAFIMLCFDLKEFDYTSISLTKDGRMRKPKKTKGGLSINTEVVE